MSDVVSDVTFVGGKAVEQTTEGGKPAEGTAHGDEREAAMAAVKAALEEHGKTAAKEAKKARETDPLVPKERGADGKFLPAAQDAPDAVEAEKAAAVKKLEKTPGTGVEDAPEEEDPDAKALKKALAQRSEKAKAAKEAGQLLEKERAEARKVHQQYQAELTRLKAESAKYDAWKKDPVRFVQESGRKPEDLIMELATHGTPEAAARRAQQAKDEEYQGLLNWRKQEEANRQKFAEHQAHQQKVQFRQSVEKQLITTAYKADQGVEQYPHVATFYKGHEEELCSMADSVADKYRAATGLEATFEEICEYLEELSSKRYRSMSGRTSRSNGAQVGPGTQGIPGQGNTQQGQQGRGSAAVSGRGLNPNVSSERRTLGTLKDLDGEERLSAAAIAVRAAIAAAGGTG